MLALRSNSERVITAARGRINDLETEDIEARTLIPSRGGACNNTSAWRAQRFMVA